MLVRRALELERNLPAALAGDAGGVHQARVASRRLREAVPVLAARQKRGRKTARKIRRVTRALGTVRELDVTLQLLDELAGRPDIPRSAVENVRAHVMGERERRRAAMVARLEGVDAARLTRRLQEVSAGVPSSGPRTWRVLLARRIASRARRLAAAVRAAGPMYAPERLHDVRIAVKKLRYALELAAEARVPGARRLVGQLKRTQDALGRINDLHVIGAHVAAVQAEPPGRMGAAGGGLDVIARTLEDECRHLHARYVAGAGSLVALAATCRTAIAPHLLVATRAEQGSTLRDADGARPIARRA